MSRPFSFPLRASLLIAVLAVPLKSQTVISGPYNGATFSGNNIVNANTFATFSGSSNFTGASVTFGVNAYLYLNTNNAAVTFDSASILTGDIRVLADGSAGTVLTNAGTINHTHASSGQLYARTFNNSGPITATAGNLEIGSTAGYNTFNTGTIKADGSGATVEIVGNVANTGAGILRADNSGVLLFTSTNTTANLGTVQLANGGRARYQGTLTNTGATLPAPSGGSYELFGGTILNGSVASNALTFTGNGGTLNGATLLGTVNLPANTYSNIASTSGPAGFSGANVTWGNNAYFYLSNVNAAFTIDSTSTLTGDIRILSDGSAGTVLTNAGTINHTHASSGQLYARTFNNSGPITATAGNLEIGSGAGYNTFNTGTIAANGSGATVEITGNVANTGPGILRADNSGVLLFTGANTTANLGTVQLANGGRARYQGTLTNTGATLPAPSGGSYELFGGTILNGSVASNALTFTGNGGTLNGATLLGTINVPANTYSNIASTSGPAGMTGANVTWGTNAYFYLSNVNAAFTIDSTSTLTGDIRILSDGSAGTVLTNAGTINHTHASSGQLYARTFNNSGPITATAGTLEIGSATTGYNTFNTGTITANGSGATIEITGNVANTGAGILRADNSGVLLFYGFNTTANLGTVQLANGGRARFSGGTLTNTGATLPAPSGGSYELFGGTILNGSVASNALTFTGNGGTLNGATLLGTVNLPANTYSNIASTSGPAGFSGATVTWGTNAYFYLSNPSAAFTIDSTSTLTGDIRILADGSTGTVLTNAGTINHTHASSGQLYARTFNNSGPITATAGNLEIGSGAGYNTFNTGTIAANGSGATVEITGNVANTGPGILRADNSGVLLFTGANTTANLGTVQLANGGRARFQGTLTNTGATLTAPSGGSYELFGGTILNGSVASNALTFTGNGGTLNGATLLGTVNLPANTHSNIASTAGPAALTGANVTWGTNAYFYLNSANAALNIDSDSTLTGDIRIISDGGAGTVFTNAGTINHTHASTGDLYARTFNNSGPITATAGNLNIGANGYSTTNSNTITSNGAGTRIDINGNFSNTGTLVSLNSGQFMFTGTNSTGPLGNVQLSPGARALLNGTLSNAAANLPTPTGGVFELFGGTINNGTFASSALTFTSSAGVLSGVTLTGNFATPASTHVYFTNGTTFTGALATLAANSGIYWQQVGTLSGKAITQGNGSYLYMYGANSAVTLDPTTTINGTVRVYSDGSLGTAITNQGSLTHTSTSNGDLYARTFTNTGTILASAGTVDVGNTTAGYNTFNTGPGTITASGASTTVYLNGNVTNTGTLIAQNSGQLIFRGNNTSGNLGNVQIATGGRALLNGTLSNAAANLAAPSGGMFELYNGTINGGTIASGALTFTSSGGVLSGVTLTGNFATPASTHVYFTGGTTFTGALATIAANSGIYWQQTGTLSGKAITQGNGSYLYMYGANSAVTLDPTTTINGTVRVYSDGNLGTAITNQGSLTHTSTANGDLYARTFTNTGSILASAGTLDVGSTTAGYNTFNSGAGTITASGASATVYLNGNVTNTGTLIAQNSGQLIFRGNNTSGNLGNVQISTGGRALLNGTLSNAAANLTPPSGGMFELYNGTINGGTIASGALTFTSSGGVLSGVTLNGNFATPASTHVYFTGGTTFTGTLATIAANSGVYWQQTGTLSGKAITQGNGSYLYMYGANSAVTLDPTTTINGTVRVYSDGNLGTAITNQGSLTHTSTANGDLYARTFTNTGSILASAGTLDVGSTTAGYNTFNSGPGTITASGASATVYLNGNVTNTGTLIAQNSGQLIFRGNNTSGNLGNVQISTGGRALLNGTLSNAAANLTAPSGGMFELYNGTINGGTVANGALSFTSSGGTLAGVTLTGNLAIPASSHVYFTGGTTFTGAMATFGTSSGIYWQQTGTLSGKSITQANGSYLYVSAANSALTLDPTTTITGDVSVYTDGSAGTAITNQGILSHSSGTGDLFASTFVNAGSITATAGTLNLGNDSTGYSFANNPGATITVAGTANVSLHAPTANPIVNQGTIHIQSGTLSTGNDLTNGATGTITGAGTISGGLTVAGGILAPGNSIGTLTLVNGAFLITSATTFAVELNATSADQFVFQNPTAPVNIGGGLLSLSLTLLSAPTENMTYNLIRISSGGSGITGTFAGLPTSGSGFSTTFGGTPYAFVVNYQANLISITAVPEPSTYALLGAGLVLVAIYRRRSRR